MNNWTNTENKIFYNKMSEQDFRNGAINGGLENNCDLQLISNYITQSESILEIGAGYGRVIEHLLNHQNFKGELFAIERNEQLYSLLTTKFNDKRVTVINKDLRDFTTNRKFSLMLWMWASICEFSKQEQLPTISNLMSHLETNGYLVIDMIPSDCETIQAVKLDKDNYVIRTNFGDDFIYLPSEEIIKNYITALKAHLVEKIIYNTKTNKQRVLYIIQKTEDN
ncbi:MAG: methyltransferase domain-containing protein [Gammaproteobacteria bacterium]|nr:methyltransferase domain-containing protein [Gammaproteobacteria bacterium]